MGGFAQRLELQVESDLPSELDNQRDYTKLREGILARYREEGYQKLFSIEHRSAEEAILIIREEGKLDPLKYLSFVDEEEYSILIALPVSSTYRHRSILEDLQCIIPEARCTGGGFVMIQGTIILVYGQSCEFGPADHEASRRAFARAIAQRSID